MAPFLFVFALFISQINTSEAINVDFKSPAIKFKHFWKSTGFCPPDPKNEIHSFLLSNQEKINIALIGALPNNGIKTIRVHWLFNLIFTHKSNDSAYNFTYLDKFMDFLHLHGLKPGFELMGLPEGLEDKKINWNKQRFWENLVYQTLSRYIGKFGPKEVSEWRFETWNEPDLKHYNLLNFTLTAYLHYVNGCSEGLKKAFSNNSEKAKLGGPAGLFKYHHHPLCWGLLELCNRSYCPIQYVSFHRKGSGTAEGVLNGSFYLLDLIRQEFPKIIPNMSIANDESDIIVTWSKGWSWRGDVRYAAMVVNVIANFYKSLITRKLKIEVLSFDNGFLNYHPFYFTQRTLFARFQMNDTHPPHNQFIKKPIYSVMALLSLLGDEYFEFNVSDPLLNVLATQSTDHSTVSLLFSYANNTKIEKVMKTIRISLQNLPLSDKGGKFVAYLMDNSLTNPFKLWRKFKAPVFPNANVRKQLRDVEEPFRLFNPTQISSKNLKISVNVSVPSVFLLHICSYPQGPPGIVTNLSIINITRNEILLTWNDNKINTKCILSYQVEFAEENSLDFKRINLKDTIFLSYHYMATASDGYETTIGKYRVCAVDYWHQPGQFSEIVYYP